MAKIGDVIRVGSGDFVITEDGLVPTESMSWGKNALLGAGSAVEENALNIGNLVGLVSDERASEAAADRASFRAASAAQNPGAALTGGILAELPLGLVGGKYAQTGIGALQGFAEPVNGGVSERIVNAVMRGGMSFAGESAGEITGRVMSSISRMLPINIAAGGGGGGVDDVVTQLAKDAEGMGFRATPGMKTGNSALRTVELGFEANPVTTRWVRDIADHNQALVTRLIGRAAGISDEMLDRTGGRITGEALNEALIKRASDFDTLAQNMSGGVSVSPSLLERINKNIDLNDLKENGVGFQRWNEGILEGRDYQELRSSLTAYADSDRLLPSQKAAIGSQIDALDMAVSKSLPEDALPAFARSREQSRWIESIQKGKFLDGDGLANVRTAENRVRSTFGDAPFLTGNFSQSYPNGTVVDFQPETGEAMKAIKIARSDDFSPFVGSSGTGERREAAGYLQNLLGMVRGEPEAFANIVGMGKLGDAWQYIGERNPQALVDLLGNNPHAFIGAVKSSGAAGGRESHDELTGGRQ